MTAPTPDSSTGSPRVFRSRSIISGREVVMWAECHLGSPVWALSVSRSGILCGCDDGSIVLLNAGLECCFRLFEAHGSRAVMHVAWAPDGLHFLSVGTDKVVRVWSVEGERTALCIFSMPQISPVISAAFHPNTFSGFSIAHSRASSSLAQPYQQPECSACTVFVLTADRKVGVWTDGQVERYESLSSKDAQPVCMSLCADLNRFGSQSIGVDATSPRGGIRVSLIPIFLAIGTKAGELLLYKYTADEGVSFTHSLACKNRRGRFSTGTPIIALHWMSPKELIVSSQDNRIRLIEIGANGMNTVGKYKGHQSSAGDVALAAFVVSPPFSDAMLLSGSECGRVFVWTLDEGRDLADASVSLRTKLTGSHAARPIDSWKAISAPDKLTAVAYAPWNPERGSVSASSSIAASLDGVVRLFITKYH